MSKSLLATFVAMALSWLAVSCSGPVFIKPAAVSSAATAPKPVAPAATATPATPVAAVVVAPAVATVSPWTGAGIFFYPFVLICLTFGIALYASSGKTA
jgi:hypothetical protein